jgi:hypothetical protein
VAAQTAPAPPPTPAPPQPQPPPAPTTTAPPTYAGAPAQPSAAPPPYAYPPPPYGYAPPAPPAPPAPVDTVAPAEPDGDLEVVADFAALGLFGSIALIDARDLGDEQMGTLMVMAGAAGGAGLGFLVADRVKPTRADGHATTMGLSLGVINGALLLVPLGLSDSSEEILPTLLVGGTVGAIGGLALSRRLQLTSGQTLFATNLAVLGLGTSAIVGALIDRDGELGRGEMSTLAIGLDGGAAAGVMLAPKIDWSYRRARMVGIASMIGFMGGSVLAASMSHQRNSDGTASGDPDPDTVAIGVLTGMWGGFLVGAKLTGGWAPDPAHAAKRAPVALAPLAGRDRIGVSLAGAF